MSIATIHIGGPATLGQLGQLFDLACEHNVWIAERSSMQCGIRGKTFLGQNRMLGDPSKGSEEEALEHCRLIDWMQYCVWAHGKKKSIRLWALEGLFSDHEFSGDLHALKFDYKIQLPSDNTNQCEALIIRPWGKDPMTLYASDNTPGPRYTVEDVMDMLDNPVESRLRLVHDAKESEPLTIIP